MLQAIEVEERGDNQTRRTHNGDQSLVLDCLYLFRLISLILVVLAV